MDLPTLTISAGKGWMDQRERFSGNIAGKEQKNYTLLSKNELSYNKGNSKLAKYGVVFKLKNFEEALVPRVYHSFKTTSEADPDFIEYVFATKNPDRELAKLITSGARMDGLLNINFNDFMDIKISIPDEEEQTVISKFLVAVDNVITLHQRKINTLETFKKVYLSVMFTNKNDNTPLLRFKNFTEAWEQRKFKNFVEDISTGRSSFISGKLQSNKNKFPILGSTNLIGYDSSYDYSGNFILTARVGANAGNIYRFQGDVKISDNTIYIQTKNLIFTYYLLLNFNLKRLAFGTGQPLIKASEIEKITFRLPSTAKEYRKIGQCLNNIDNLTTLHQRKLYTLKKLKQAYLNKMFI